MYRFLAEYVQLYVDWILNASVELQFMEFKRGFDKVSDTVEYIKIIRETLSPCGQCGLSIGCIVAKVVLL